MNDKPVSRTGQPNIEDYATVESYCNGVPVYSFSNITYVYGVSPDLLPSVVMQVEDSRNGEGNTHPVVKIKPKKSWEIKHNLCGSEHENEVKSAVNDSQPFLPIHLIDGDPDTVWSSWGCAVPDGRQEWIRIDLPVESTVASIVLVCSEKFSSRYPPYGKSLPKEIEIKLSRDAWHWETVYESKDFSGDASGATVIEFQQRPTKQIWIIANNFPDKATWAGHVFSIGEVEVRDPDGNNMALVSRGAGVTVSSVTSSHDNDRFTQDALWGPLQYDLGNKWVRVRNSDGQISGAKPDGP